ncbi:MAG TPA: hypothetical protein VHY56_12580 [Candidatus Binataceae bacterium]|jgi:hypothetical protein|nr:hypothetical protein [Candidatus Binataceae bacterium]
MRNESKRRPSQIWAVAPMVMAAIMAMVVGGCSAGIGNSGENGPPSTDTKEGMLGLWQGTSLATCQMSLPNRCNAEQLITITLVPSDNGKIGGYYKCAYGNMNCYNMNTTGKIAYVAIDRSLLTVLVNMPDGTSCRYQGRNVNDAINGGYSCTSGGSQFEQGVWRAKRQY